MKTVICARYIYTGDGPVIRDGGVVFDERGIIAIGDAGDLVKGHAEARRVELGNHLLLPAFVNAHTHLELSSCVPEGESALFAEWLLSIPQRSNPGKLAAESSVPAATEMGIEQCLRFGVGTVGDISQFSHLTRPILARSRLRGISYGEVLGLAKRRFRVRELLERAVDREWETERLRVGITPHAPYTVDQRGYEECLRVARERGMPLATHLGESAEEQDFLENQAGVFRELWEGIGQWEEPVETYRESPIAFAQAIGMLDYPTLLAHVNYCNDEEMGLLARGKASVVYCPRTHAYFGHPPHRFREMLAAGINVAVGTDSCASSQDLNPLEDLRLLHRVYSELTPEYLLRMITQNAAKAMGLHDQIGSITRGKEADFVAFAVKTENPLLELLEMEILPAHLWIGGKM
ncbi:MAG TPA: amidohydrolase family protein [Tepidisphaeraceae bacterium]|jgi:cytosine/adenosine deaminase-related metal-dependent hydrolase|nr:amidohydrolase family protein [Tepidisphaeraceae bacterium]